MNSNLIENSFYTKYLKYKMKYINLKNTIGGTNNDKNIMIVSHNTRIRCIIESLDKGAIEKIENYSNLKEYVEKPIVKSIFNIKKTIQPEPIIPTTPIARLLYNSTDGEIRFKNCAILLIKLVIKSPNASIELVDEGTILNRKKGWYFGNTNDGDDVKFPTFTFPISLLGLQINDIEHNYNIYIMRHGEATHNTYKISKNVFWDTDLTKNGIEQAESVAKSFKIKFPDITFDLLCASKLRRSRNTLNYFIKNYDPDNINNNDKIYVLPCNHELAYHKENCDKNNNGIGSFYAPENRSNCDINKDGKYINAYLNSNRSKDYLCEKVDKHVVDWTLHQKYYEDINRKCEDSNFIKILVQNYDNLKENKNNYTF
jgi:bisphosphoglycerate-dependent phosphoglycerate mutase